MTVRVRIAPAPSGSLHIGNARTALYNWLFARHHGGRFILRIEDTDQERVREEYVRSVIEELEWLGLDFDEGPGVGGPFGPYRQSERLPTYQEAADKLLSGGHAYRCWCTPEELAARRAQAAAEHRKPGYDGRCRNLTEAERQAFESEGRRWVMRFRVPEGSTTFTDAIAGEITVSHEEIEDFPIMRQNGFPIYILGAAVDDALMQVSHVIRGMDLQAAAPRQILLLEALGHPVPAYAHIPLVFGAGGRKLSKREGGGTVAWFREHGFLPDALVNSLVLLGTGFGDDTIVSREQMVERFSLDRVHGSPAALNEEKLSWMNGEYIRALSDEDLASQLEPWLANGGLVDSPPGDEQRRAILAAAPLIKTRLARLEQAPVLARSLFVDVEMDRKAVEKQMGQAHVEDLLARSAAALRSLAEWKAAAIEEALRSIQVEMGLKPKTAFQPLRVAITGELVSPPLFESMEIIGRERCLARLEKAASQLGFERH